MFDKLKYRFQEWWYNFMESAFLEKLLSRYEALSERDKKLLKNGFILFVVIIFIWIMISFVSGISKKEESINEIRNTIAKVEELNDFVSENRAELQKRKSETSGSKYVSLMDLVEKQQVSSLINPETRVDLKETPKKDIEKGKYVESRANVKYEKINIRQLAKLLSGIEKNETFAVISSLKVKRRIDDIRYIDVEFEVIARTPK